MTSRRQSTAPRLDGDHIYNRRLTSIRMGSKTPSTSTEDTAATAQELEKTEQSITIALQEIDRNISRASRMISEGLLPILDKYGKNSQEIMNQGGFWKDFLERSVNVKLETYEEDATVPLEEFDLEDSEIKAENEETSHTFDGYYGDDEKPTKKEALNAFDSDDDNITSQQPVDLFASTPRRSPSKIPMSSLNRGNLKPFDTNLPFKSPLKLYKGAKRPLGTPARKIISNVEERYTDTKPAEYFNYTPKSGILRHQVVDKNWRIQATPRQTKKKKTTFADEKGSDDDDLDISPEYPRLQSDIFNVDRMNKDSRDISSQLMTPQNLKTKVARHAATPKNGKNPYLYEDTDSSIDFMQGISPPVTLQFGGTSNKEGSSKTGNEGKR